MSNLKNSEPMVQISRKIRADQKITLEQMAKDTGIIDSDHLRQALDDYFEKMGYPVKK